MLLHNSYINVAIANILLYLRSPYDLQKLRYSFTAIAPRRKNGRGRKGRGFLKCPMI